MSELEAKERYYWGKIRQALKAGRVQAAASYITEAEIERFELVDPLLRRIAKTFAAGCEALGDPASAKVVSE